MSPVNRSQYPVIGLILALVTVCALAAVAADPEPAAPVKGGAADPTSESDAVGRTPAANLKVNQAELDEAGLLPTDTSADQPELKPMIAEINLLLEDARLQTATLQQQFDREPNADAAMDIMRRIEQVKQTAELDILRTQMRYAQAAGDQKLAAELEASLTEMTTPRQQKQPIDRPAPAAGNR